MIDESTKILQEILRWVKFQNLPTLKTILTDTLITNEEKLIYEYADGEISSRKLGAFVGMNKDVLLRRWNAWAKLGIIEKIDAGQTKYKKIISLEEVGIEFTLPKQASDKSESKSEGGEQDKVEDIKEKQQTLEGQNSE